MGPTDGTKITPTQAESLTALSEPWLSCDDCFEQIDLYVDSLVHDHPAWTNRCGCTWPAAPPAWRRPSR